MMSWGLTSAMVKNHGRPAPLPLVRSLSQSMAWSTMIGSK